MDNNVYLNWVLSALLRKVVVPSEFHDQVEAVKLMLKDDVSGLVDALTDFAVDTATVDFSIESENQNLTNILQEWLYTLNSGYEGKVPVGIRELAKEYFKERWKHSSFAVLKIAKWEKIGEFMLPTQMFFVDGGSIWAQDKDNTDENLDLLNYDYYLGKGEDAPLDKNVIFAKTNGRWFDEYPTPYLVKRGVYHNWKIVQSLKDKEVKILDEVIPYFMLIQKGTEGLATSGTKTYSDEELKQVKEQFQQLMDDTHSVETSEEQRDRKTPVRATNFDEEIKHVIPDLETIFKPILFQQTERNILAGLGFIDVVQGISDSRRESVLNPKAFIEEVKSGVEDFKQILKQLVLLIIEQNKTHIKFVSKKFYVMSSPVKAFMTDDFKAMIRSLYDRGLLSKQTTVELGAEVEFRTEKHRRKKEVSEGLEVEMYPPVVQNKEGTGADTLGTQEKVNDTEEEEIPEEKKNEVEKQNYNIGKEGQKKEEEELEVAPYNNIGDLPSQIKNNMDSDLQSVFVRVFNNAYKQYGSDIRAFRISWSVIRNIAKKGKDGKWHRKSKRANGKLEKVQLTRALLEKIVEDEEKNTIDEVMKVQQLEITKKKNELINSLLTNKEKTDEAL
jgi:cation transport regulator ChaB